MANALHLHLLLLLLLTSSNLHLLHSLPLSTSGRFIVDASTHRRVKLRCVNWAAHMPAVLPEGLDRRPLHSIASRIASLGFNCVRLTYATRAFTDPRYAGLTVTRSLESLGLHEAAEGVRKNNGWITETTTVAEAMDAAVHAAGRAGLMVVMDNHVSEPMWCCGDEDGNGFFGDRYFDAEEWLLGLHSVATRYRNLSQVVGMSIRNELRGPNQRRALWYEYVTRGVHAIHQANPDALIIISGLNYALDLSFLSTRPLVFPFDKIVFEAHAYAYSEVRGMAWEALSPTQVCQVVFARFERQAGFVTSLDQNRSTPLFLSEFGVDQREEDAVDNRFLSCLLAYLADRDMDWGIWALQGSYYQRDGVAGFEETYGVLDSHWDQPRNPNFRERYGLIMHMLQDPQSSLKPYQIIYHPPSGRCLRADLDLQSIELSDCRNTSRWIQSGQGSPIRLMDTNLCLNIKADGSPVMLTTECGSDASLWKAMSSVGFQMGGLTREGRTMCLHVSKSDSSVVLAKECKCLEGWFCSDDPQAQWFRVLSSNVS